MTRLAGMILVVGLLTGCATPPSSVPPVMLSSQASPCALEVTAEALMSRGYVVRHADASLGRLVAVFSRWPGYRVLVAVESPGTDGRLALTALRGGRPMPRTTLERLASDIALRLAECEAER
ncbi:hypothetical protein IOC61_02630 [Halomonas sp. KAO]|uniref:hypothetical protein n=1 Tax=unclassified Halomonas TaxID=2609666 RepID=UPI00189F0EFB|nr:MULTISPECIES: hypothetical protein [unclassified Halomonas]MBF7052212.1 hypothetical protein [Halomonas sp. KAO]MDT0501657.1 hypothetical protein [Halomonas sp. PAR7]MDT0512081.1 hypothetical protein [Halomonas sp. LES1]MDT0590782.1 hypothetical protein [Halomonas sp. PAR8]